MTLLVHVGSMGQLHVFLLRFSVKSVKSVAAFCFWWTCLCHRAKQLPPMNGRLRKPRRKEARNPWRNAGARPCPALLIPRAAFTIASPRRRQGRQGRRVCRLTGPDRHFSRRGDDWISAPGSLEGFEKASCSKLRQRDEHHREFRKSLQGTRG